MALNIRHLTNAAMAEGEGEGDHGAGATSQEVARLRIFANRRAEAANPKWVEDVRMRKLTIANGQGTAAGC